MGILRYNRRVFAEEGMMDADRFLREETYAASRLPVERALSLTPDAYRDDGFYKAEQTQVFARNWVAVAPLGDIANAGDIITAEVGGQSLIIVRGDDDEVRAFHNVCRHRGTRLCEARAEGQKRIVCPYHGWGYNLRGECIGTPLFDKGDNRRAMELHDMSHLADFDRKDYGLLPARAGLWGGFVFVCLDDDAPPLEEMLGDLPQRLAAHKLGESMPLATREYDINCNWKLLLENAVEYYHLPWVHPRLAKTSRVADHKRWQGRGMYCGICTSPVTATDDSGWLSMRPMEGLSAEQQVSGYFFGLFPNLIYFVMPSHAFVLLATPHSPSRTVERAWLMAHPQCASGASASDIGDVFEFWNEVNMEDVAICEKVQRGVSMRAYPGGRLCYHFEEPVHRFQNMVIDSMLSRRRVPPGDEDIANANGKLAAAGG